ncbi:succinate dehydrogenase/fumarate reductase cytochrome b subunit [Mucilaginibacter gynuensis]|uniref:Succinate dehydrogenase/fumarate reductase cytochrome b subunit n=1 Tax=Mucilaginibacter gynuensis TaxID=1302236 RepID=A0ABP8GFN6_9SPHI
MNNFTKTLRSSLGKKLIMALTGLFMCTFLIVHLAGNMTLFVKDEGYSFNVFAHFMTHFPPVEVVGYLLYISILVHAVYALILTIANRKARPVRYSVVSRSPVKWASVNMGLLGSMLLLFLVIHMANFWYRYKYTAVVYREYRTDQLTGKITSLPYYPANADFTYAVTSEQNTEIVRVKDLFAIVTYSFSHLWYVLLYLVSMIAVAYHLLHGFQSAFRTLGWTHRKYTPLVEKTGIWLFAVAIPLAFAAMPAVYYIKITFIDTKTIGAQPRRPVPVCGTPSPATTKK